MRPDSTVPSTRPPSVVAAGRFDDDHAIPGRAVRRRASRPPSRVDRPVGAIPGHDRADLVPRCGHRSLTRWKVPVAGVEVVPNDGVVSGRITLAGQRDRRSRPSFELRWFETTGWEFDLHHAGDPEPMPWRFLHFSLVPAPAHVASFTDGLLRGEDLGMAHPARFRRPGDDLPALTDLLRRHSRDRAAHPLPGSSPR